MPKGVRSWWGQAHQISDLVWSSKALVTLGGDTGTSSFWWQKLVVGLAADAAGHRAAALSCGRANGAMAAITVAVTGPAGEWWWQQQQGRVHLSVALGS